MDIAKIKPGERFIEMKHPGKDDFKVGIRVSLVSINDDRMKKLKRSIQDRRIKLEQRGKAFSAEQLDDNRNELAYNVMTGWEWHKDDDGEEATFGGIKPEFNRKSVFEIMDAVYWFRDQIEVEASAEKDFFG